MKEATAKPANISVGTVRVTGAAQAPTAQRFAGALEARLAARMGEMATAPSEALHIDIARLRLPHGAGQKAIIEALVSEILARTGRRR